MTVNIAIIARDRPRVTRQCLESLALNTPRELYNLTIIDDGSEAFTEDAIRESCWHRKNWVSLRNQKSKGIVGLARNLSFYWAQHYWGRGDYLYSSDNDAVFTSGWLETLIDCFESSGFALLGGYNHPYHQPVGDPLPMKVLGTVVREYLALAGPSMLMRWETLDRFGPFPELEVGLCKSEDWEFCQRIRRAGLKIGAVWPHIVLNAGIITTFGEKAVGHEYMQTPKGIEVE